MATHRKICCIGRALQAAATFQIVPRLSDTAAKNCKRGNCNKVITVQVEWMTKAACTDPTIKPEIFFTSNETGSRRGWDRKAKKVCAKCGVRTECLKAALRGSVRDGVWGGLNPTERHKLGGPKPRGPGRKTQERP